MTKFRTWLDQWAGKARLLFTACVLRGAFLPEGTMRCGGRMDSKTLVQEWYDADESLDVLAKRIDALIKEQRQEYADLMDEAAEDVAEWGSYADEYVQNKWNLEGTIQSWQDRAAAIREGK
jgi:hypothetical protein